jgi:hypothetical protein
MYRVAQTLPDSPKRTKDLIFSERRGSSGTRCPGNDGVIGVQRDDRSILLTWQRSAVLASLKEDGVPRSVASRKALSKLNILLFTPVRRTLDIKTLIISCLHACEPP